MLTDLLRSALERRVDLLASLADEGTDCVRLLHGTVEGAPGVAVDRYGPVLLVQTWRRPLEAGELEALVGLASEVLGAELVGVWNHRAPSRRSGRAPDYGLFHEVELPEEVWGTERSLRHDVRPRHHGHDPLLFLDLRAGRRRVAAESQGRSVLNLFAYTCGVGLAAQAGGASEVWNVDFAASALEVGRSNEAANGLTGQRYLQEDCLPVMRQLAGLKPGGRRGKRPRFTKLSARVFDLVVLDPPRWARSAFGAVDVIRDYPTLFKPALLATAKGGHLLATHHVASVAWEEWVEVMRRCATKAGRPLRSIERILPDTDLPSPDGQPPLKMAWIEA